MQVRRRLFMLAMVAMLGVCPLLATSIVYTITGTLGPILSGSDPLGANGQSGTLTITASSTLTPKSHTSTSATYTLPVGAITVNIGGTVYGTTGTSTLVYKFPSTGKSTMVVTSTVSVSGISGTVVGTASLAKGSFTSSVTMHPQKFKPSPQTLKAATTAGGPGSQVKYTVPLLGTTVLGIAGTASN